MTPHAHHFVYPLPLQEGQASLEVARREVP